MSAEVVNASIDSGPLVGTDSDLIQQSGLPACRGVQVGDAPCSAWAHRYDGGSTTAAPVQDFGSSQALSPDLTTMYVVGATSIDAGTSRLVVQALAIDTGIDAWTFTEDLPAFSYPSALTSVTPDGEAVLVWVSHHLFVLDAATGGLRSETPAPLCRAAFSPDRSILYGTSVTAFSGRFFCDSVSYPWAYSTRDGRLLWQAAEGAPSVLVVPSIAASESQVFIGGRGLNGSSSFALVQAYSAAGELQWSATDPFPLSGQVIVKFVSAAPDGSRVYAGGSRLSPTGDRATVFSLDAATGETLWVSTFDPGPAVDILSDVLPTMDGNHLLVGGYTFSTQGAPAFAVRLDAETGAIEWSLVEPLETSLAAYLNLHHVSQDDAGDRVVVTSVQVSGSSSAPIYTLRLLAVEGDTGRVVQVASANHQTLAQVSAVQVSPTGNAAFLLGITRSSSTGADMTSQAYPLPLAPDSTLPDITLHCHVQTHGNAQAFCNTDDGAKVGV